MLYVQFLSQNSSDSNDNSLPCQTSDGIRILDDRSTLKNIKAVAQSVYHKRKSYRNLSGYRIVRSGVSFELNIVLYEFLEKNKKLNQNKKS